MNLMNKFSIFLSLVSCFVAFSTQAASLSVAEAFSPGPAGQGYKRPVLSLALVEGVEMKAELARFFYHFSAGARSEARFVERVRTRKPNALEAGVITLGANVAEHLQMLLAQDYSSVGADNIDHLAAVLDRVLVKISEHEGRSLSQKEVDELVLATLLTDLFAKGREPEALAGLRLAPLNKRDGGELVSENMFDFWTNFSHGMPAFMAGVLLHGLVHFEIVARFIPEGMNAQRIYAEYIGHHVADFIAAGLFKLGITPDFKRMEELSHLSPDDAKQLAALFEQSINLAGHFRPIVDVAKSREESAELCQTMRDYHAAAGDLREVIAILRPQVREQMLMDDEAQFTPIGISKWLNSAFKFMPESMPKTNRNYLEFFFQRDAVAGYYASAVARGVGDQFIKTTNEVAHRLGMIFDEEKQHYRVALPHENPYEKLSANLRDFRGMCAESWWQSEIDAPLMVELARHDGQRASPTSAALAALNISDPTTPRAQALLGQFQD